MDPERTKPEGLDRAPNPVVNQKTRPGRESSPESSLRLELQSPRHGCAPTSDGGITVDVGYESTATQPLIDGNQTRSLPAAWKPRSWLSTPHRRPRRPQPTMNAQDRLHFELLGEPFLFASLRIDSFGSFIVAALFVGTTCFSER